MSKPAATARSLPTETKVKQTRARISKQKRETGLKLLQELKTLTDKFPAFAGLMKPSLDAIQRETERTYHSDRERVLLSLEQGAWIVDDLIDDTGLSRWDVEKILKELEAIGLVEKSPRKVKQTNCEYLQFIYRLTHRTATLHPPTKQPTRQQVIS